MSNFTSTSFSYTSTTNTSDGGTTTGRRFSTASTTDKDGLTIIRTAQQDLGQPAIIEERRYDKSGQEQLLPAPPEMVALPSPGAGMGEPGEGEVQRITEVNDETASYGGGDLGTEVYGLNSSENVGGKWGALGPEYVFSFFAFIGLMANHVQGQRRLRLVRLGYSMRILIRGPNCARSRRLICRSCWDRCIYGYRDCKYWPSTYSNVMYTTLGCFPRSIVP